MKRFIHFWSLVLLLAGVCLAQTPSNALPVRLPFGSRDILERYARAQIAYIGVRLRYEDNFELIHEFEPVRFSETNFVILEDFVPQLLSEKLEILHTVSPSNAQRPIKLVCKFTDERGALLFGYATTFNLQLANGQYSVPSEVVYGWSMVPAFNEAARIVFPNVMRARLLVRNGENIIFDETISYYTQNTNNSRWAILGPSGHLVFPTELITSGYQGELTVWVGSVADPITNLKKATYDLATGVRTFPIEIQMTRYGKSVTVRLVGAPYRKVIVTEMSDLTGTVRTNHQVLLGGDGSGSVGIPESDKPATSFFKVDYAPE